MQAKSNLHMNNLECEDDEFSPMFF